MNNLSLFLLGLALIYTPVSVNGKQCFSINLGYPCCEGNVVYYIDDDGQWGVENGEWCGIGGIDDSDSNSDSCFAVKFGYPCCETCNIIYSDENGDWGKENRKWCGIKDSCTKNKLDLSETDFDFSFLKLENNKKNMLYSPLSIKYALSMLQEGAVNNTYTEITNVIGNTELTKYSNIDNVLSLANGLFIRDTYYEHVKTPYINSLEEKYDAEVIKDGFTDAKNANQWIEDKTFGIIKDILNDDAVQDKDTVMLLINALAIDMEWSNRFNSYDTRSEVFYLDNGETMQIPMLGGNIMGHYFGFYKDNDVVAIKIDLKEYDDIQFEFMAVMPRKDLSSFVENVTKEQINEIDENISLASSYSYGVDVKIPKFKFSYNLNLKEDLKKLGINEVFDKYTSNLTKMSDSRERDTNLYISDAFHKADIEFAERGITAAAATGFLAMEPTAMKFPENVIINRPFMFIIRDKNTKDIWFTGTVYEP